MADFAQRAIPGPAPRASELRQFVDIQLRHVSLSRSECPVLRDVSWRIRPGERWVLVGANGAGKSQLLKLIAGDVWPAPDGRGARVYRWKGETFDQPVGVKQEIAYVGAERQDKYERYGWDFTVTQILGTGLYRTDIPLDSLTPADQLRIGALLRRFEIAHLASRNFLTLSYGQRRLVLLARALATRPRLLLLDELFEGLDRERHALISGWLESTGRNGMAWVLATHRTKDVPRVATHIAVLEGGGLSIHGRRAGLRKLEAGLSAADSAQKRSVLERSARLRHGRTRPALVSSGSPKAAISTRRRPLLVQLSHATVWLGESAIVRDISLEVRAGDCWVVHGANGSGKTTLLRTIYGDHGVGREHIKRFGIEPGVPLERFKRHVGWVAANLQSDHPLTLKVSEVMQSGRYASIGLNEPPTAADRAAARKALDLFGLGALAGRTLRELSYGQVRRVLFARAFVRPPKLLLLDEPFAGVDGATRMELRHDVERALADGVAVVMTTHHDDEWPHGVTHELELRGGQAAYCGSVRRRKRKRDGGP